MVAVLGIVFLFAVVLGIPIMAVILRASIALVNKVLGKSPVRHVQEDFQNESYDSENPYSAPESHSMMVGGTGIPEPGFGYACVMTGAIWLVHMGLSIVVAIALNVLVQGWAIDGGGKLLLLQFGRLCLGLLVATIVLSKMLPTTFRRSMLVVLFQVLIAVGVSIVIAIIVGVVGAMM